MIMVCTFRDDFRQQIVPYLCERGYEVCTPSHRQDVIAMATQQKPLVLLLDMYVTHPSGLEVLRDLRAHGFSGKVVLLGGSSISSLISQAHRLGVDQVVGDPQGVGIPCSILMGHIEAAIRMTLHALIAKRAYELYESRGRTHGHDQDDWLEAERFIFKREPPQKAGSKPSRIFSKERQPKKSELHLSILEDAREVKQ
ncbi:MAG: hypothetical protein NPIRA02_20020 [Nitrospirales bacterium]|nr:MAG: hypothetical protein NPIRA02_20020 [Nitrospirales bacterium]